MGWGEIETRKTAGPWCCAETGEAHTQTHVQTDKQTDAQTDRRTDRHTDKHSDRQAWQTVSVQ